MSKDSVKDEKDYTLNVPLSTAQKQKLQVCLIFFKKVLWERCSCETKCFWLLWDKCQRAHNHELSVMRCHGLRTALMGRI